MASPEPPSEERELSLIEKVDFRIILHSNDEAKLQETLDRCLRALLLKAESPHASVRTRTVEVAVRIGGYIQPPAIILPVKGLIEQFKATTSRLLKTLDFKFIQHSLPRLELEKRRELLPELIRAISKERLPFASAVLFHLILRLLPDIQVPSRGSPGEVNFRESLGLQDSEDANFLANWFGKLMVLKPSQINQSEEIDQDDYTFLTKSRGPETWNQDSPGGLALPGIRVLAVKLLASAAFRDDEKFIPAIWAAGSQDARVSSVAEGILRRTNLSLEDKLLVYRLWETHSVANCPVRTRILECLSRSTLSASETFANDMRLAVAKNMIELENFYKSRHEAVSRDEGHQLGPIATRQYNKLASATLSYIAWAARVGASKDGYEPGSGLLYLVFNFLECLGWPIPHSTTRDDDALRGQVYEVLGTLARTAILRTTEKLAWAQRFFKSLGEDPSPEVVVSIEGALSSISYQFSGTSGNQETTDGDLDIHVTLRNYIYADEQVEGRQVVRNTRYAVTKFANDCLPLADVEARWIDIIAVAGRLSERNNVVEEGRRGLDISNHSQRTGGQTYLPNWDLLVTHMFIPTSTSAAHGLSVSHLDQKFLDPKYNGQRENAVALALDYCKKILLVGVLSDLDIDPSWESSLDVRLRNNQEDRIRVRNFTSALPLSQKAVLTRLLEAGAEGTVRLKGKAQEDCAMTFVELASLSTTLPQASVALRLFPMIRSDSYLMRTAASRAIGMLGTQASVKDHELFEFLLSPLLDLAATEGAVGSELNAVEGALQALGHVLPNRRYISGSFDSNAVRRLDLILSRWDIPKIQPSTKMVVLDMLSGLWTASIPAGLGSGEGRLVGAETIIGQLLPDVKKKNEKAIRALGRLCIAVGQEESAMKAISALLDLTEIKEVGVHLAIGEALAVSVGRWESISVMLGLDVAVPEPLFAKVTSRVDFLLKRLLDVSKATKPSILRAYGIWLFSLIQYCSHLEEVTSKLRECQAVFIRLLSARDELVQETASRGLSLVFQKGSEEIRKDLVSDLSAMFTGDAKERMKVGEESEVFGAGDLETQDGKSVTSYKDVINLANEAGDPSLVYRLMNMSMHAATWSARSAFGRFGLGNILSEASLPPSLYVKLYRYRFDPVASVRRSMTDIWNAAVKNSGEIIDKHFHLIMRDLLDSLFMREWRVREASCAAIEEVIMGRPLTQYEHYYQEIWDRVLKVLDDKKTTVREAALRLSMALSKTLITQLESSPDSATAKSMLSCAIPFLLSEKAMGSNVAEVSAVSAQTIIKITKHGGKATNPYSPVIIIDLLGFMSTSEWVGVNYLANKYGGKTADMINKARSAFAVKSPLWEAVENCLRNADKEVIEKLMPKFAETIQTSVGIPTKLGCSQLIVTLVSRHAEDFRPHVATFLKLMRKQIFDKNIEVASAYARSAAYLMKIAKPRSREVFLNHLVDAYLKAESDAARRRVADMLEALSKLAADQFKAMESMVLPLVFFGKHDSDQEAQKTLSDVWDNNIGSNRTVIRVLDETLALIDRGLDTTKWALRHAGALAAASAVEALGSSLTGEDDVISIRNAEPMWPVLEKSLALKTFEGKEKVFDAFVNLVARCPALWKEDAKKAAMHEKIAMREAKRKNVEYRTSVLPSVARFAAARPDLDLLDRIIEVSLPALEQLRDDGVASGATGQKQIELAKAAVAAIAEGYNPDALKSDATKILAKVLDTLLGYLEKENLEKVRPAWYRAVESLMATVVKKGAKNNNNTVAGELMLRYAISLLLDVGRETMLVMNVRMDRARAFDELVRVIKEGPLRGLVMGVEIHMVEEVGAKLIKGERSLDVLRVLRDSMAKLDG